MYTAALLSGLVGALVSAFLALWVRWFLDGRTQRLAERRIAYVHYLSVSEVLAAETLLSKYIEAHGLPDLVRQLRDPAGSFDATHKACVLLADSMLHPNDKEVAAGKSLKLYPKQLRSVLSGLQATAMDADALAKLPRNTIEAAMRLQADQQVLLLSVEHWIDFAETGRRDWITPEALFEQWQQLRRFLASAHRLREKMISASVVSKAEADQLFARQLANSAMHSLSSVINKPKIEAAQQHFGSKSDEA